MALAQPGTQVCERALAAAAWPLAEIVVAPFTPRPPCDEETRHSAKGRLGYPWRLGSSGAPLKHALRRRDTAPTGRNPLTEGPLRRYTVGVLSGSKARKRVYRETVSMEASCAQSRVILNGGIDAGNGNPNSVRFLFLGY